MLNTIDSIIDKFADDYSAELLLVLLQIVALPEQGGRGYHIEINNPYIDMDGWDVDHENKTIYIDQTGIITNYDISDYVESLKEAIETEFLGTRMGLLPRILWGTGKVILAVVEGIVGVIGILVPEPGTTIAGIACVVLASNNLVDGVTQLAGTNQGNGVNLLGEAAGWSGAKIAGFFNIDPATGYGAGKVMFAVTSLAVGSIASIKILIIPGRAIIGSGAGGQPGGYYLGRLSGLYQSTRAGDGMTILNIENNAGQSILRFVTHGGKLVVNGRIVGAERVLKHSGDAKEILKGLIKLLLHGAKF
ncbi:TPA: hypothetical protein JGU28_004625 [Salmonella enterica]|nr:hypothetical protein [Salmonella enterica]